MGPEKAFRRILDTYKRAWEQRNPSLATQLFTRDATYYEDPFDDKPARGHSDIRRYWEEAVAKQRDIEFTYQTLYTNEDHSVWGAEWTASYTKVETGERNELKGVLFCQLTRDKRKIKNFWEYWHLRGGAPSFTWREFRAKSE